MNDDDCKFCLLRRASRIDGNYTIVWGEGECGNKLWFHPRYKWFFHDLSISFSHCLGLSELKFAFRTTTVINISSRVMWILKRWCETWHVDTVIEKPEISIDFLLVCKFFTIFDLFFQVSSVEMGFGYNFFFVLKLKCNRNNSKKKFIEWKS